MEGQDRLFKILAASITEVGVEDVGVFHAVVPPVGSKESRYAPDESSAMQKVFEGQSTAVIATVDGSTAEIDQDEAPAVGWVDVAICPVVSAATQKTSDVHQILVKPWIVRLAGEGPGPL